MERGVGGIRDAGAATTHPSEMRTPEPPVRFTGFGESSLDSELPAWVLDPEERWNFISGMNFAIDAAFQAHGVTIPFPRRGGHIDRV
jgi:potassium-dependent mechanosensitive channel